MIAPRLLPAALTLSLLPLCAIAQTSAPTLESVQAMGPYGISAQTLAGTGFKAGTVYVPAGEGPFPVVVICPGFTATQGSMAALGRRLATHGVVVTTIDTNTGIDLPASRANQLLAALKATLALDTGAAAGKMDASRTGLAGWSMGGGGALEAAGITPGLKAVVAYTPWNTSLTRMKQISVPSAIVGAQNDIVAPVNTHSKRFYNAIPATTSKLLGVQADANHMTPKRLTEPMSLTNVSWFKRFLAGESAYGAFLSGSINGWSSFTSNGPF